MEAMIGGNEAWSDNPNTWSILNKILDLQVESSIRLINKKSSSQTTFPSKKKLPLLANLDQFFQVKEGDIWNLISCVCVPVILKLFSLSPKSLAYLEGGWWERERLVMMKRMIWYGGYIKKSKKSGKPTLKKTKDRCRPAPTSWGFSVPEMTTTPCTFLSLPPSLSSSLKKQIKYYSNKNPFTFMFIHIIPPLLK